MLLRHTIKKVVSKLDKKAKVLTYFQQIISKLKLLSEASKILGHIPPSPSFLPQKASLSRMTANREYDQFETEANLTGTRTDFVLRKQIGRVVDRASVRSKC